MGFPVLSPKRHADPPDFSRRAFDTMANVSILNGNPFLWYIVLVYAITWKRLSSKRVTIDILAIVAKNVFPFWLSYICFTFMCWNFFVLTWSLCTVGSTHAMVMWCYPDSKFMELDSICSWAILCRNGNIFFKATTLFIFFPSSFYLINMVI